MNKSYLKSDIRSLELHRLISVKLKENPGLIQIAIENIKRWKIQNDFSQSYLDEWLNYINLGLDCLLEMMTSETDEAQRLRSSSPFVGILSKHERDKIFKKYYEKN